METAATVYNFEVAQWHTYFVSALGVLVHNDCVGNGYYKEGRPNGGNPREDKLIRKDKADINSEEFKEFLRNNKKDPNKWKKVMETWETADGDFYERHYWTNGINSYYHD